MLRFSGEEIEFFSDCRGLFNPYAFRIFLVVGLLRPIYSKEVRYFGVERGCWVSHSKMMTARVVDISGEKDELYMAQTENRHLKDTIVALRDELESERNFSAKKTQDALALSSNEIKQLKETAAALRDALEAAHFKTQKEVQEAIVASSSEIKELKETVGSLRNELERQKIIAEDERQKLLRNQRDELKQLQDTVSELRDKLEGKNG